MAIEWETAAIPDQINSPGAGFAWIAGIDHTTEGKKFDVYINNKLRFTFISSGKTEREFRTGDGGILGFQTISTDQHGDLHGYMWAWLPKSWLEAGKSQTIKIVLRRVSEKYWKE